MRVLPIAGALRWIESDELFAFGNRLHAIEADTGTESIEGVNKQKIRVYRKVIASRTVDDHFGFDNLIVLFATASEWRMLNMMLAGASPRVTVRVRCSYLLAHHRPAISDAFQHQLVTCFGSQGNEYDACNCV